MREFPSCFGENGVQVSSTTGKHSQHLASCVYQTQLSGRPCVITIIWNRNLTGQGFSIGIDGIGRPCVPIEIGPVLVRAEKRQYHCVRRRPWGKFTAEIRESSRHGAWLWLATFDTAEEAAVAYGRATFRMHGPRALLNFPPAVAFGGGQAVAGPCGGTGRPRERPAPADAPAVEEPEMSSCLGAEGGAGSCMGARCVPIGIPETFRSEWTEISEVPKHGVDYFFRT